MTMFDDIDRVAEITRLHAIVDSRGETIEELKVELAAQSKMSSEWIDAQAAELAQLRETFGTQDDHLHNLLAAVNAELAKLRAANAWVPVGERLPEVYGIYLVLAYRKQHLRAFFPGDGIEGCPPPHFICDGITHWRPLPAAPEESEK
jgi:hypothetical protein